MSKMRHCKGCKAPIVWDAEIIQTEDGDIYHEDCCFCFPIQYGVMVDDVYKGNSEYGPQTAFLLLDSEEYIDIEVDEDGGDER